jgi:hypothetical protein
MQNGSASLSSQSRLAVASLSALGGRFGGSPDLLETFAARADRPQNPDVVGILPPLPPINNRYISIQLLFFDASRNCACGN